MFQVEGLMDDLDFKAKVTRAEFEELCADLFERVPRPVQDALAAAEMSMVSAPPPPHPVILSAAAREHQHKLTEEEKHVGSLSLCVCVTQTRVPEWDNLDTPFWRRHVVCFHLPFDFSGIWE